MAVLHIALMLAAFTKFMVQGKTPEKNGEYSKISCLSGNKLHPMNLECYKNNTYIDVTRSEIGIGSKRCQSTNGTEDIERCSKDIDVKLRYFSHWIETCNGKRTCKVQAIRTFRKCRGADISYQIIFYRCISQSTDTGQIGSIVGGIVAGHFLLGISTALAILYYKRKHTRDTTTDPSSRNANSELQVIRIEVCYTAAPSGSSVNPHGREQDEDHEVYCEIRDSMLQDMSSFSPKGPVGGLMEPDKSSASCSVPVEGVVVDRDISLIDINVYAP